MEFDVKQVWPGWENVRLIGEGSFGKVYEIMRNNFGIEEHCAMKVISIPNSKAELESLKNEGMDDRSATEYYRGLVEEFTQEIALMSKLKGYVNVVGYEDYAVIEHTDTIGWDIVIRMELLKALPLHLRDNPFSTRDVVQLTMDMCDALDVCHKQKIIHRDIKPDNMFVSAAGNYKLGDFGVARTIEKTVSGLSKKGTYTYMAPEVYKGENYGMNADLYSLGIVMYKLLNNNREPFLPPAPALVKYSDKNEALVRRIGGEAIPPLAQVSDELNAILLKACAFKSEERYQTAAEMKADLTACFQKASTQATAHVESEWERSASLKAREALAEKQEQKPTPVSEKMEENSVPPLTEGPAVDFDEVEEEGTRPLLENFASGAPDKDAFLHSFGEGGGQMPYTFGNQAPPVNRPPVNQMPVNRTMRVMTPPQNVPQRNMPPANVPAVRPTPMRGVNVGPQYAPPVAKPSSVETRRLAMIIGWVGFALTVIAAFVFAPYTVIQTIAILVAMIFLTGSNSNRTTWTWVLMIASVLSLSFVNIASAILYFKDNS